MKRIAVSAICVVMCCIFLCQHVAAEVLKVSFDVSSVTLVDIDAYNASDGLFNRTISEGIVGVYDGTSYFFDGAVGLTSASMDLYNFIANFKIEGQWESDIDNVSSYLWFSIYIDYSTNFTFRFDDVYYEKIKLVLDDGTEFDNYFLSDTGDYSYLLSFIIPLEDLSYDFASLNNFSVSLPLDCNTGAGPYDIGVDCTLALSGIQLTYDLSAITSDDVDMIINSLDNVEVMLDEVKQNQNITVKEIIATREVIAENGEKLQEISDKQDTVITVLEQLPAELRDLEVGDPYDKSLDTSEIVAYESAYDAVMEEVDVDQVVNIMDGGISLNQDGMYNEQSFNSVSGLVMDIIDATGLMPLIMISLTFGLACFIIGRSGNL